MIKTVTAACLFLLVACRSVPYGYTDEGWIRMERSLPNRAQSIQWIEKDYRRSKVRRVFIDLERNVGRADSYLAEWADMEMIKGEEGAFIARAKWMLGGLAEKGAPWSRDPDSKERTETAWKEIKDL